MLVLRQQFVSSVLDGPPIFTWLVLHAACLRNKYHVGQAGSPSWERVARNRSGAVVAEFGERIMFLTRAPNKERHWPFGVWLGLVMRTQETCVWTTEGVVRAWKVEGTGEQDKWRADEVSVAKCAKQQTDPRREGEFLHTRITAERDQAEYPVPPKDTPPIMRSFCIRRGGVAKHGCTPACK